MALNLPRNVYFNTGDDVRGSEITGQLMDYSVVKEKLNADVIVGRHAATLEILKKRYPNAEVLTGDVTPESISGKNVVGALPPHLVALTNSMQSFSVNRFDYANDGDMTKEQLEERGYQISNWYTLKPVK